jgi:hypothetical protein
MPSWSVVATVKAPEEKVLAFVAHHLSLGAAEVFLYFDDPDDPAQAAVAPFSRVRATACTPEYWVECGGRSNRHQNRQSRNAREAYGHCRTDWLCHIDVDEFILAGRPVSELLGEIPADMLAAKLEPFEAMHDPLLPDASTPRASFAAPSATSTGRFVVVPSALTASSTATAFSAIRTARSSSVPASRDWCHACTTCSSTEPGSKCRNGTPR